MDWQKQTEDMVKNWTETQKKMWDNWTDSMKNFGTLPSTDAWAKTVDTWQGSVKHALETQNEWSKMWVQNLSKMEGTPEQLLNWAKQSQEINARWNEVQKQMWDNWFETMKKVEPNSLLPGAGSEASQKMFQAWQDAAQQVMKAQTNWVEAVKK